MGTGYAATIAVCLVGTPVAECDRDAAVAWIVAPETTPSLPGCMMHGMTYAASSRLVDAGSYPKIFCSSRGHLAGEPAQRSFASE